MAALIVSFSPEPEEVVDEMASIGDFVCIPQPPAGTARRASRYGTRICLKK
jgi:hypothetical protein